MIGFKDAPPVEYRWFLTALSDVFKKEGFSGLYRGVGANIGRASSLAAAEMASYDTIKPQLRTRYDLAEGLPLHAATACCSGFIAAFVANPKTSEYMLSEEIILDEVRLSVLRR